MSTCWQIRCCPASLYNICNAYLNSKNCWEWDKEKPCCKRMDLSRCKDCEVFKLYISTMQVDEKTTICEECGISFSYKTSKPKRCSKCRKKLSNQKQLEKYYAEKDSSRDDEEEVVSPEEVTEETKPVASPEKKPGNIPRPGRSRRPVRKAPTPNPEQKEPE